MIAFDRFSSLNYSLYDFKVLDKKVYLIRSLRKEDLKILTKRMAYHRLTSHPQVSIIKDLVLERLEGFFYDRFSSIVTQDLSICVVNPDDNRIVAALIVKDAAIPAEIDEAKWPEFKNFLEADELVKSKFPETFKPKICGVSANLVCFWTDPEYNETCVPMTIATALLLHPRILTFTYVASIFVVPNMEPLTKILPGSKIIEKIHFKDLKDNEGNYYYKDELKRFEEKGYDLETLQFSVFVMNNMSPKL
mmetsp:Transcript_66335/g.76966  ORF Transcript_66335/g.76966 Transcript_66335/m.76966 type:complete len:249 (-) Transcript_66335:60-806(-)